MIHFFRPQGVRSVPNLTRVLVYISNRYTLKSQKLAQVIQRIKLELLGQTIAAHVAHQNGHPLVYFDHCTDLFGFIQSKYFYAKINNTKQLGPDSLRSKFWTRRDSSNLDYKFG